MSDIVLTKKDKEELLNFLGEYSNKISETDIEEIEQKLDKKVNHLKKNKQLPAYVNTMFKQMRKLSKLIYANDIEEDMRNKVIAALHYFIWAEDKIPDYMPVVGYLDDAFIISIVYSKAKGYISKH